MEKSSQNPSFGQGLELAGIITKAIASAAKKTNADSDRVQAVIGKPGVIFQLIEGLFAEDGKIKKNPSILQLISGNEKLMIEALDGKAYISDAKKTFKSYIDGDFKNWGLNQSGPATAETLLDVSEMTSDGTFVQIFTGITPDLEKLVMTQAQIIRFCEKHPTWLRQEGYATFFLTKVNGEYFVVHVGVFSGGLDVGVDRLESDGVWRGGDRHRVVSPQLFSFSFVHSREFYYPNLFSNRPAFDPLPLSFRRGRNT